MNFSEQGQLQISCDNECVVACDWEIFSDRLAELFKIAVMHEYVVLNDTESLNAYGVPVVNMEVEASLVEQPCVACKEYLKSRCRGKYQPNARQTVRYSSHRRRCRFACGHVRRRIR